jgi:hypothetical protein
MNTTRLDLNLLVTLEALLTEQNVTKAAARLHLSQPAVSAQLQRLREVFDDLLLIPAQRGMTPTAKALELLDPLRHALDQVRATITTHKSFEPAKSTLAVAIACTDYLQAAVIKPLPRACALGTCSTSVTCSSGVAIIHGSGARSRQSSSQNWITSSCRFRVAASLLPWTVR